MRSSPTTGRVFRLTGRRRSQKSSQWVSALATGGLVLGTLVAGTISTLATIFARTVVTPAQRPSQDIKVLKLKRTPEGHPAVVLSATNETTVSGRYTLIFDHGEGLARIGEIIDDEDTTLTTVTRRVEEVYYGELKPGSRGRWAGFLWPTPAHAGYDSHEVVIAVDNGVAPAWVIPPDHFTDSRAGDDVWAIMVHGRGSKKTEGLRAVEVARQLGMTSLLVSYRNDGEAPAATDGRYGLGTTEWVDIEAAVKYALHNGAQSVVIFGWSMGAAVALQLADRSRFSDKIVSLVLTGPVINWVDVLAHQARINRLPESAGRLGQWLVSNPWGRRITGLAAPVDLKRMDWVSRSEELTHPTLIIHSQDDDFVPVGPSVNLAKKRPDLVSYVYFDQARHTREWNVDPLRWNTAVKTWLELTLARGRLKQLTTVM